MGETTDNRPNNQEGQSFTAREFELIQELVRSRMEKNEELQYESFEGYELPPRTQFSMLKKPAVSIKYPSHICLLRNMKEKSLVPGRFFFTQKRKKVVTTKH